MMRSVSGLNWEDPLTYLPSKPVQEYAKGQVIDNDQLPPTDLYVVIRGRVKISTIAEAGDRTVGRIVSTEGLFGEQCLIGLTNGTETSIALDDVKLMSWSRGEIERQIERAPRLGVALAPSGAGVPRLVASFSSVTIKAAANGLDSLFEKVRRHPRSGDAGELSQAGHKHSARRTTGATSEHIAWAIPTNNRMCCK